MINQGGTARERLCMDIFHGGVFLFSNQEVKMNFSKAMKAAVIIFTGAIAAAGLTACGGIKTEADSPSKGGEDRIHRGAYRRGGGVRQVPGGRNPYGCRRN